MRRLVVIAIIVLQAAVLFSQDLRVTAFIYPIPSITGIPVNASSDWTFRVRNFGTTDVPVGDTIGIFSSLYSGNQWTSPIIVGAKILTTVFKVNDSMEITTPISYSINPGLRSLRFAAIWSHHVPASVYQLGANFNFTPANGIDSKIISDGKIYYSNGNLCIEPTDNISGKASLQLYNARGQQVFNNEIILNSNSINIVPLSGKELSRGIYVAEIICSGKAEILKFIIP